MIDAVRPTPQASAAVGTLRVSIIVPAYNAAHQLPILFEALERQTLPREAWELIVVDDGSSDETIRIAEEAGMGVVTQARERGGSFAARNIGVELATAPIVAFTDADCVPEPEWLAEGVAAFERDPGIDLLAGGVEIALPERPSAAALVDAARCLNQERYATREGFGVTANLWVRREIVHRVGGFNGIIVSGGDTEFCHRATATGARLVYAPDVLVHHPARERLRDILVKSWRLGYGAAQHRQHADGPLRDRPLYCLRPGSYLPKGGTTGIERIERRRGRLGRWDRFRMSTAYYFFMKLPSTIGNAVGATDGLRGGRKRVRRGL